MLPDLQQRLAVATQTAGSVGVNVATSTANPDQGASGN
jgi:hypothetical protein